MTQNQGTLLESGTNELEIVEFQVGVNKFGINVIKVKEIIEPLIITFVPHVHDHVEGIVQLRGEVLPVVNLEKVLGIPKSAANQQDKYIVTEFNNQKVIFHVSNVKQIHRISWEQIEKPSNIYRNGTSHVIGVIKREEEMILLLDFERIIVEINPELGINVNSIKKLGKRERSNKKIVIAEDSPLLRKLLHDTLNEAGYVNLEFFENGKDAIAYLEGLEKVSTDISEHVHIVVTDIEMPQLDGHTFTRRIKENSHLAKLPVLIFSSLITEDLRHKGDKVGAEAQISKPEIAELVLKIDQYIL
ncbi:two-component system chemotaxis response regulator CheV [Psychrobacillus insolitus]|uniref:Two-component system chemotaxis response regulator CheV n=1 Tax=Psychrobacillus insolitus TaxID=1461 RepID=A0A2W7NCH1_9BACI|nr:chemotaxis protein [Psychrobacillus insolitus]PZX08139.1 two-component system chemotaxis response regulator CheV [Psychrobacillus insolitus]